MVPLRLEAQHRPDELRVEGRHPLQRALDGVRRGRAHGERRLRRPVRGGRRSRLRRRGGALGDGGRRRRRLADDLLLLLLLLGFLAEAACAGALARHAHADGLDLGVDGVAERAERVGNARGIGAVHDAGEVEARVLAAEPVGGAVVGVRRGLGRVVGAEPDAHPVLRQPDLRHPLPPLPLPHAPVKLRPPRRRPIVFPGAGGCRERSGGKIRDRRRRGRRRAAGVGGGEGAEELALAVVDAGAERRRDGGGRREVGEDGLERRGAAGGQEQRRHRRTRSRAQRAEAAAVHGMDGCCSALLNAVITTGSR